MRFASGLLVVLAACGFPHGSLSRGDASESGEDADGPPIGTDDATDAPIDAPIDAPAQATCSAFGLVCLNGSTSVVKCNGGCWAKCTINGLGTPVNPQQADAACNAWGGKLAPIRDANDQACVATTLFPTQASFIGFEQSGMATTVSGGWTWNNDGIAPSYTNWDPNGQPDDANGSENGQEQCAFMPTTGLWHDTDCTTSTLYRFSCRKP